MVAKYVQRKLWPSRKYHLFLDGSEVSICGCATIWGSYDKRIIVWGFDSADYHPYDDLNYCQACRRVAESSAGRKYIPLSKHYEEITRRFKNDR